MEVNMGQQSLPAGASGAYAISFFFPGAQSASLKSPKFIAPRNMTFRLGQFSLSSGSGTTYSVFINGVAPTGMVTSAAASTSSQLHSFASFNANTGDVIQINVVAAGSSANDLAVTLDAVVR
jgi:hypothetical protein